jgi:hypothetical protein
MLKSECPTIEEASSTITPEQTTEMGTEESARVEAELRARFGDKSEEELRTALRYAPIGDADVRAGDKDYLINETVKFELGRKKADFRIRASPYLFTNKDIFLVKLSIIGCMNILQLTSVLTTTVGESYRYRRPFFQGTRYNESTLIRFGFTERVTYYSAFISSWLGHIQQFIKAYDEVDPLGPAPALKDFDKRTGIGVEPLVFFCKELLALSLFKPIRQDPLKPHIEGMPIEGTPIGGFYTSLAEIMNKTAGTKKVVTLPWNKVEEKKKKKL